MILCFICVVKFKAQCRVLIFIKFTLIPQHYNLIFFIST